MRYDERACARVELGVESVLAEATLAGGEFPVNGNGHGPSADGASRTAPCAAGTRYLLVKSVIDWIAAMLLFLIAAPMIAVMAILTKLSSPGPAFYSQIRLGRRGRSFRMYKIRSMTHNCEAGTGAVWSAGSQDTRITRLGRILRETHLDELPQLVHVLQGHMSLIGPRPERPEIVARIERSLPRYRERLLVKPGLTGLAQVQLPADENLDDVRRKLAYDLHYVRHVSLWLDVRIMSATTLHLSSLCLNTLGKLLVKSCGATVERDLEQNEQPEPPQRPRVTMNPDDVRQVPAA